MFQAHVPEGPLTPTQVTGSVGVCPAGAGTAVAAAVSPTGLHHLGRSSRTEIYEDLWIKVRLSPFVVGFFFFCLFF